MCPAVFALVPLTLALALSPNARAQQSPSPPNAPPAWLAGLTPAQRSLFDEANKSFNAGDFSTALPTLRRLHEQVPGNDTLTKYTVEAAINTGNTELAASLLEPLLRTVPDDPQALGIEAHLYGQAHDTVRRDAVLDAIQKLHDAGKPAPKVVLVEKDTLPDGTIVAISDFIEPQSRFHIVLMAQFLTTTGQRINRVALESDDIDQNAFGQAHPEQAAAGVRVYSMDSYGETRNAAGQVTGSTHGTLCPVPGCFMTGRPPYELFRTTVLNLNKAAPISSTATPASAPPK